MPRSGKSQEADNSLVKSYVSVRRALGFLGLFLPPLLLLVAALTSEVAQSSISAYYYGAAGNILERISFNLIQIEGNPRQEPPVNAARCV